MLDPLYTFYSDASKPRKRKKISKKITCSQAKVKKTTSTVLNSGPEVILPPEIWLQIFQYVVAEDGALPFLIRYIYTMLNI